VSRYSKKENLQREGKEKERKGKKAGKRST
jgi:hypothetical protein